MVNNKERRKMKLTQVLTISLALFAATILSTGHVAAVDTAFLSIDSADSGVELRPHDMQDTQTYYILRSENMTSWSYLMGMVTKLGTNIHVETGGDSIVIVDGADSQTSIVIDTEHQQKQFYQITTFTPPLEMVWVWIDDPGVSGHEGFNGEMSRYETTNAQYCEFLNAALASGDIYVSDNVAYGANGSNGGADFVGQLYFRTYAISSYSPIVYSGGSFSVRSRDGLNINNHPVVEVSWYGAVAFCNYYGYRLPTEWEWQAVADYTDIDPYTYGCGTTINHSKATYYAANPLGLSSSPYTSPVNYYPSYGYGMNDMAGNVWEWTDNSDNSRVVRGGCWNSSDYYCTVSARHDYSTLITGNNEIGFRACR
jgi:Sulfatase-modifying factor enzyme 1